MSQMRRASSGIWQVYRALRMCKNAKAGVLLDNMQCVGLVSSKKVHSCSFCKPSAAASQTFVRVYSDNVSDEILESFEDFESPYSLMRKDRAAFLLRREMQQLDEEIYATFTEAGCMEDVFGVLDRFLMQILSGDQIYNILLSFHCIRNLFVNFSNMYDAAEQSKLATFNKMVKNHQSFISLLNKLRENISAFSPKQAAVMVFCLNEFQIELTEPIICELYQKLFGQTELLDAQTCVVLASVFRDEGMIALPIQGRLFKVIADKCLLHSNPENLEMLALFAFYCKRIIPREVFKQFIESIEELLNNGTLQSCETRTKLNILHMIGMPRSRKTTLLSREILLSLINDIETFPPQVLALLSMYIQQHSEPRNVLYKLQERASRLINDCSNTDVKTELLISLAPYSSYKLKHCYETVVAEHLDSQLFKYYMHAVYKILRHIKTTNFDLCNKYWENNRQEIEKKVNEGPFHLGEREHLLKPLYSGYMYFNNNLGGSYRNYSLEAYLLDKLSQEIKGPTRMMPSKVFHMCSFVIGYNRRGNLPGFVTEYILENVSQMNLRDVARLSRGIQVAYFLYPRGSSGRLQTLSMISQTLNRQTFKLNKKVKKLEEASVLLHAFHIRSGNTNMLPPEELIDTVLMFLDDLNSKTLRRLAKTFKRMKYSCPPVFEAMSKYIVENKDYVLPDTTEYVLTCFYVNGYQPEKCEEFTEACMEILLVNSHQTTSYSLLRSCLALGFFKKLDSELIHAIFNVSYLDQLEEEVSRGYSEGFVHRVRHMLMELNRTVCISIPEERIPWFHESYCQELQHRIKPQYCSDFKKEVFQTLQQILGDSKFIRTNSKTPFHYNLDFEFWLDGEGSPVEIPKHIKDSDQQKDKSRFVHKVAIQLRDELSYCINVKSLVGEYIMERQQLEILGYTVVEVPHFLWFSMAYSASEDKLELLRDLIRKQFNKLHKLL